jgi:S-formylglutathione hydrolase FrmB
VRHPELFRAFVDIAGDLGPNVGTKEETIARLYGGNAAAWAEFDPSTVISQNLYNGLSGWFAVADGSDPTANVDGQDMAAQSLCALGRAHGIDCGVHTQPGGHDWQFAAEAFAAALPWLAATLGASGNPCADGSARPAPITAKTVGGCR